MPAPARAPRPEPTWAGGGASARERRSLDEPFRPTHPKFGVRMSDDLEGGMEKKQRDNSGDDEIRPGAARPDYQKCCDDQDRKSTRLNSSHYCASRMPSSACKTKTHKSTHT